MAHKKKEVLCDKKGLPIIPKDTTWRGALKKSALFLACGVLLPVGLVLYNLVPLSSDMGAVKFIFAIMIFAGAILLLYGVMMVVTALVQKRRTPPEEEIRRIVLETGETCEAAVKEIKTKKRRTESGEETVYRYTLEFEDLAYQFKRRFISKFVTTAASMGDKFTVHYFPESNVNYYIEIE